VHRWSHSKKPAVLMVAILAFASQPGDARQFATQDDACSEKGRITTKDECADAKDALKDIKKTQNKWRWGGKDVEIWPDGLGVIGEGGIEENPGINYPDCAWRKDGPKEHFTWCPDNTKLRCDANSVSRGRNEAVCKAFCDEVKITCPMGQSLRKDAATTRGSEVSECCESDEALQNLDTASQLIECMKREKSYEGLRDCAMGLGKEEEGESVGGEDQVKASFERYQNTYCSKNNDGILEKFDNLDDCEDFCGGSVECTACSPHYSSFHAIPECGDRRNSNSCKGDCVSVKKNFASRLFAVNNAPVLQGPSTPMPLYVAGGAALAASVLAVSFKFRQPSRDVYTSEASILEDATAE